MSDRPTKYYSNIQETTVANSLGWQTVVASGARALHVGDIKSNNWLGECKTHTTSGHKIIFKLEVWKKICDEAISQHRLPVLIVDDGTQKLSHTWCMFKSNMDLDDVEIIPFPNTIQTNIIFDFDELSDVLYNLRYNNQLVYIAKFDTFKNLLTGCY